MIGRSASATSQHLRVLRDAGVVTSARRGNVVRYRLADGVAPDLVASFAMRLDAAWRGGRTVGGSGGTARLQHREVQTRAL